MLMLVVYNIIIIKYKNEVIRFEALNLGEVSGVGPPPALDSDPLEEVAGDA